MSKCRIIPLDDNEFTLETSGRSFHICLGSHTNGNYIAIPDWGVCSESSGWNDTFWNKEQLTNCKSETVAENAEAIVRAIKEYMS